VRPDTSTTGAPPKCSAKRSGSIVADVMISLSSGRRGRMRWTVPSREVDVQAALVRLVDDDRVVAAQQLVAAHLGQQEAVGHQPDARVLARAVVEAHRVADLPAERHAQLLGDPGRHRARRQPARLRVRDPLAPELQAQLRELRRLARAGLAGHDDDLVVADDLQQLVPPAADRQLRRVRDRGHHRQPATPSPPTGSSGGAGSDRIRSRAASSASRSRS
jgi:hypothetical protein